MRHNSLKNIIAVLLIFAALPSVANAASRSAKDYMADGIRAAYDNMHLIYQGFYDDEGNLEEQPGGYVAIWQEWDKDWNLISRTYLDENGEPTNQVDGYSKAEWTQSENGLWYATFYNIQGEIVSVEFRDIDGDVSPTEGFNLVKDFNVGEDGWSEWMTPTDNKNCGFVIGHAVLGMKHAGDRYRCHVEVEFRDVTASNTSDFWFRSQGSVDNLWEIYNPWNDYVNLKEAPEDGIYKYESIYSIKEPMVKGRVFDIAFRCDYWGSGSFRVRNVIVERIE